MENPGKFLNIPHKFQVRISLFIPAFNELRQTQHIPGLVYKICRLKQMLHRGADLILVAGIT